ncbi:hypothetical protein M0802_016249 [Mischocyttarus mexicanus]|nr:hypothetical protein M0802_016249 [Mischocyttarus mexicanus]
MLEESPLYILVPPVRTQKPLENKHSIALTTTMFSLVDSTMCGTYAHHPCMPPIAPRSKERDKQAFLHCIQFVGPLGHNNRIADSVQVIGTRSLS